ncbi:ABC transporter substrate-binding protein [Bradyrhizobium sp. CCGUVB1N3]|uniref:ABC transporter substrate-binding protein n=1 Tax=Bradyrhizobium sp. CCGUVB1N3 TaxID=2949629 RepID=UPI0020B2738E|nr:ABC transporter substrate-binding protein [Bradyrhizobium sp. CCGUVB1N3]MCP3470886.1 ABC transporter substrate-binding protein [Bradyrhizobium sp. CCGUVB1N3]
MIGQSARPLAPVAVDRRNFIRLAGASAAGWLALGASPDRVRVVASLIGLPLGDPLTNRSAPESVASRLSALIQGMTERGWVEGVNVRYVTRSSFGGPAQQETAIREILALNPDVILTSSTIETAALTAATKTIPIVFATANDPVGNGFVESLARPGGNVTGFTNSTAEMGGKWLQLLREAAPGIARVGVLFNPATAPGAGRFFLDSIEAEAASMGVTVTPVPVNDATGIDQAIRGYAGAPEGGLIALVDPFLVINRRAIAAAAAQHRVPVIYPFHYFIDVGGLMSYGASLEVRSADYVDLILRGTRAGDLPVQSPRKYELLINRKAADALGLKLPATLLARADEIRE